MTIRPYEKKDRDDVRYVCINCDGPTDMSEDTRHFILSTYCDYYIEKEGHNCFVATNEEDKAIGYILCSENYNVFSEALKNEYIPRIPAKNTSERYYAENSAVLQEKYKDIYPAHLHIDLLPEYQRMGLGRKLVDTLLEHLRNKKIPGVMLSVSKENTGGIKFYESYGFTHLESSSFGEAYGILFQKD